MSHPGTHGPGPGMRGPATHGPSTHTMRPAMHSHVAVHHMAAHRAVHGRIAAHHVVRHVAAHAAHHVVHHAIRAATRPGHRAPRAEVARFRKNIVAVHRFHAGLYRAPRGYVYRRWVFGERLPGIYFATDFWITDFLAFDLFAPPDGLVWVRYGPDALLIDRYTGEIIQVDYGVFF